MKIIKFGLIKIGLIKIIFLFYSINYLYSNDLPTISTFTATGKVLTGKEIFLDENEKFRITISNSNDQTLYLIISTNNKIINETSIELESDKYLPSYDKWFSLSKVDNLKFEFKIDSYSNVKYFKRRDNPKVIEFKSFKQIGDNSFDYLNYKPSQLKNLDVENNKIDISEIVVRSGRKIFKNYSSSIVIVKTLDGHGTGFLITKDLIMTNWHVIQDYESVSIIYKPYGFSKIDYNKQYLADVVNFDQKKDLALLKLRIPSDFPPLKLGTFEDIEIGDDSHAIGHPLGQFWTYSKGYISQIRRDYAWGIDDIEFMANVIQTQTPINPGNSGGPLFNNNGVVIGINTFIKKDFEGLNYAVASIDIKEFIKNRKSVKNPSFKEKSVPTKMIDYDDDGIVDATGIDIDEDGYLETIIVVDREKKITIWYCDYNKTQKTDTIIVWKLNEKGEPYTEWYIDKDEDGVNDIFGIDYDLDGELDFKERI